MPSGGWIRPSAVAGMFYPSSPAALRSEVERLLGSSGSSPAYGVPVGVIAPHAGYVYSGQTAAAAYRMLQGGKFSSVVVIAPSHRERFRGVSVFPGDAYESPLGIVPIDTELRDRLLKPNGPIRKREEGHRDEHAVEVQLPFLQSVLGEFMFVPLVMGSQDAETCFALGELIASVVNNTETLVVASTDLSHYLPAAEAERLDRVAREDIERFDPRNLMEDLENRVTEACGGGPTVSAMVALKKLGATSMRIVNHCTSGDMSGDRNSVVGYCSAVAFKGKTGRA